MSRADDLASLNAQRTVVEAQLGRLRPEQWLMRINLESRLQELDQEISSYSLQASHLDRSGQVTSGFEELPDC